jgi:cyanosortase A-associated protein
MISISNFARQSLLLLLCSGAIGVLGNAIINNPKSSLLEPATFDFPQNVPLPDSTILASKSLAAHTFKNGTVATGRSYRYQHQPQPIDIEIRYITDGVTNQPAVALMLPVFTKIPDAVIQSSTMKEQPGLGFYSLFVDKTTAYLSTCINPRGLTTVTSDQYHSNSNSSGIQLNRLLPWLLGRQTLRDSRCLWTVISTPIDSAAPDATMKTLETVGGNWARWWQAHFPPA